MTLDWRSLFIIIIRPHPELLPVLGPMERWRDALDAALLCSSRAGSDLGRVSGLVLRSFVKYL